MWRCLASLCLPASLQWSYPVRSLSCGLRARCFALFSHYKGSLRGGEGWWKWPRQLGTAADRKGRETRREKSRKQNGKRPGRLIVALRHGVSNRRRATKHKAVKGRVAYCSSPAWYNTGCTLWGDSVNKIRLGVRRARGFLSRFLLLPHEISDARGTEALLPLRHPAPPACLPASLFLPLFPSSHWLHIIASCAASATESIVGMTEQVISLFD